MLFLAYLWIISFFLFGFYRVVDEVSKLSESLTSLFIGAFLYVVVSYLGYGATCLVMRDLHAYGL